MRWDGRDLNCCWCALSDTTARTENEPPLLGTHLMELHCRWGPPLKYRVLCAYSQRLGLTSVSSIIHLEQNSAHKCIKNKHIFSFQQFHIRYFSSLFS
jgi:hypothetical protein